jgi:hypothetical protein
LNENRILLERFLSWREKCYPDEAQDRNEIFMRVSVIAHLGQTQVTGRTGNFRSYSFLVSYGNEGWDCGSSVVDFVSVSSSWFNKRTTQLEVNYMILEGLQEGLPGRAPGPEPDCDFLHDALISAFCK